MDKNKKLFPQRLWELVHDEKYDFCLRWSPDGQRIYLNRNDFETHYLRTPNNQFHTQKAISFVRQMNMYGFRKVDDCYYENDNFKRNCHHLLKNMVRRHSNKPNPSIFNNQTNTSSSQSSRQCSNVSRGSSSSSNNQQNENSINNAPANDNYNSSSLNNNNNNNNNNSNNNNNININDNNINVGDSNTRQRHEQPQQHSIQSLLQQLTCMNQPMSRNSIDFGRSLQQQTQITSSQSYLETTNSLSGLEHASAAISSAGATQSSLASTLYQRLAALNFGSSQGNLFQEQSSQQPHQQQEHQHQRQEQEQRREAQSETTLAALNQTQNLDEAARLSQQMTFGLHQNQRAQAVDSSLSQQQSLLARQAVLQQTLVRSLLQLKTPQPFTSTLEQNLLATLHQQSANILLNQLPLVTSLAAATMTTNLPQDDAPGPLELVVNSSGSSSNSDHQDSQVRTSSSHNRIDDSMFNLIAHSSVTGPGKWSSPSERGVDFGNEDDYCTTDHDDELFNQSSSFLGNTSSSSSCLDSSSSRRLEEQQLDDPNSVALDLAKPPPNKRFKDDLSFD